MVSPIMRAPATGIAVGVLADAVFADPRRWHPVAGFGLLATRLERHTYHDARWAGAGHTVALLSTVAVAALAGERAARSGPCTSVAFTAAATFAALGGTSLCRVGVRLSDLLDDGDVAGARLLLPSLCGRDPSVLDADGLTRAATESLAENTSDAQVAPLVWAAVAGVPGLLVYRAANTLDAMIGNRSERYLRFGWAAARFDDLLNYLPARVTGVLSAVCAPVVGGSAVTALRAWRRDAHRHPSPNAGVAEAAFAGALGVRLGGPTQYAHELEIRPTLGDGRHPVPADLRRAVRLSRAVQVAAAILAVAVSAAGRSGRPVCPRGSRGRSTPRRPCRGGAAGSRRR